MMGVATVGAMVVWNENKWQKNHYRRYELQSKDEYGQMKEMLSRRIAKFKENPAPDLWILDGGRANLNLALTLLKEANVNLDVIAIAKEILNKEVEKDKTLLGFGAVIAGVSIESNQATIFNCGDSRVYVYRKGFLEQLSYDHSVVQRLIDSGEIEPEESRRHPQKNIVTSAICGDLNSELPIFYSTKTVLKNDMIFFICSDGVWESGAISKLEVCFSDLDRVIACLEKIVIESEIEDNFSVIIVKIEEDRVL
jgi:serine/threonine protein phosphatase PrpC